MTVSDIKYFVQSLAGTVGIIRCVGRANNKVTTDLDRLGLSVECVVGASHQRTNGTAIDPLNIHHPIAQSEPDLPPVKWT